MPKRIKSEEHIRTRQDESHWIVEAALSTYNTKIQPDRLSWISPSHHAGSSQQVNLQRVDEDETDGCQNGSRAKNKSALDRMNLSGS